MVFKSTFPDSIPPVRYEDLLSELLWEKLSTYGNKILLVDDKSKRSWTGHEIKERASRVATYLIEEVKLRPRDCCVLFYPHSDEILIIALGILFAGGSICSGAHEDPLEEHKYMIGVMKPKLVFADKSIKEELLSISSMDKQLDFKICIVNDECCEIDELNGELFGYHKHLLLASKIPQTTPKAVPCQLPVQVNPDDPTFVLLTSGSTGRPKPVARSQRNSIYTCFSLDKAPCLWHLNEDSIIAGHLPLDHGTGMFNLKMTIAKGSKLVIMECYELEMMLSAIERYKITDCMLGSGYLHNLMSAPDEILDRYDLSSMKNFIPVGSRVSSYQLANRFMEKFKDLSVRQMLGMTECGMISFVPRNDCRQDTASAGLLVSNVIIKLLDQNTGAEISEFNQPGELYVAGPMVASGYIGAAFADQSRAVFREDGFYRTHDICFMSPENRLTILGRDTDVLCLGDGWKVLPQEIESVLADHPGIQEAAVVGIPHPNLPTCHAPRAYVVRKNEWQGGKLTEDEVFKFVASKLSEPKQLVGGIKLMDKLPRISVGKVDKKSLLKMDGY